MNKAMLIKKIFHDHECMHLGIKFTNLSNLNKTYYLNRIIVEISAKYIDLIYMLYIYHKTDKRYTP